MSGVDIAPIPFHRPFIGKEEEEAVLRVLRSGWLTTGAETLAFEKEFAAFLTAEGAAPPRALAVNSATSGLHLALEALGAGPGDLVFVPSLTFTSTAEVVRYLGADPVFVDIGRDSFNIDPAALEAAIIGAFRAGDKRPKAVIPVHYGGVPCDMTAINALARRNGLSVVEDAAHTLPVNGGKTPGGDVSVFSFYATKPVTTGEGGMAVTACDKLADRIAVMRSHGIDRSIWNRYTDTDASWYYQVTAAGFKYNLPDLLAALGRVQLGRAVQLLEMRRAIAAAYNEAFSPLGEFITPKENDAWHLYPLRLRNPGPAGPRGGSRRNALIENLRRQGIGASVHFIPLHIMPYYKERYHLEAASLPLTMECFNSLVSLPIWPGMSEEQTGRVIEAVKTGMGNLDA
ncbi:MAG: DegT/DnrJ/EryC1/StrS aminotransferase family protein [Treponema sp.]|jgi:dTDP-4-amino-4,6-dideoxygalactose transaminase|nr:DegT/DnrJ/EryC1/StrS aminotransferase family protein [Treponema sp.]